MTRSIAHCAPPGRRYLRVAVLPLLGLLAVSGAFAAERAWGDDPPVDTLVVCRSAWQPELAPWLAWRRQQGHGIAIIEPSIDAVSQRQAIQAHHAAYSVHHVVLMGDVHGPHGIPTGAAPSVVTAPWGADPEFASDFLYSDLNDDGKADVAVGRISVERRDQLRQTLARILAYERTTPVGSWQQRIEVVGGVGGFGPLIDGAVERAVQTLLVQGIPAGYQTGLTYANWKSPYCPALPRFQTTVWQRYHAGCLLWVYAGHGHTQMLDQVEDRPILHAMEVAQWQAHRTPPIAALLSCNSGNFEADQPCLAEAMTRSSGGPIAVLASTSVSMPYGSITLADALLRSTMAEPRPTLGESYLAAQQELAESTAPRRRWIDQAAGLLGTTPAARQAERLEHLQMFHLLGDPLLRVRRPAAASVSAPSSVAAGETIQVDLDSPIAGPGRWELACQRGRLRFAPQTRSSQEKQDEQLQCAWDQEYHQANRDTWCHTDQNFPQGKSQLTVTIPSEARGLCQLRFFVANGAQSVLGAAPVFVRAPTPAPLPDAASTHAP